MVRSIVLLERASEQREKRPAKSEISGGLLSNRAAFTLYYSSRTALQRRRCFKDLRFLNKFERTDRGGRVDKKHVVNDGTWRSVRLRGEPERSKNGLMLMEIFDSWRLIYSSFYFGCARFILYELLIDWKKIFTIFVFTVMIFGYCFIFAIEFFKFFLLSSTRSRILQAVNNNFYKNCNISLPDKLYVASKL